MPQLGYSLRVWAQDCSSTASFSLNAGVTTPRGPNSCLLLDDGIFATSLGCPPDTARQVLAVLVRSCAPDHALVDTGAFGEPPLRRSKPPAGWLLYPTGAAAEAARTQPEAQDWEGGVLVTATPTLAGVDVHRSPTCSNAFSPAARSARPVTDYPASSSSPAPNANSGSA